MEGDQLAAISSLNGRKTAIMFAGQARDVYPIIMTVIYKLLQIYNLSTFIITMLDAFYQSLICFFVPYLVSNRLINILTLLSSLEVVNSVLNSQDSPQSLCCFVDVQRLRHRCVFLWKPHQHHLPPDHSLAPGSRNENMGTCLTCPVHSSGVFL